MCAPAAGAAGRWPSIPSNSAFISACPPHPSDLEYQIGGGTRSGLSTSGPSKSTSKFTLTTIASSISSSSSVHSAQAQQHCKRRCSNITWLVVWQQLGGGWKHFCWCRLFVLFIVVLRRRALVCAQQSGAEWYSASDLGHRVANFLLRRPRRSCQP